jgi:hypothetical protein
MLLNILVYPNLFKHPLKSKAVVAAKWHYFDAVIDSRNIISCWRQRSLQPFFEGIDNHILADYELIVGLQCSMRELIDHWKHNPDLMLSIDLKHEDITIVIFVDDAEITIAVGGTPEHGVALYFWKLIEYHFNLNSFLLLGLICQTR